MIRVLFYTVLHTGIRLIRGRIEMFSLTECFIWEGKKINVFVVVMLCVVSSRRVDAAAAAAVAPHRDADRPEILFYNIAAASESPNGT